MVEKFYEDERGIHYVKNAPERQKPPPQRCRRHGCMRQATCIGRLYVPPSTFSKNWNGGLPVTILLAGLFWCNDHFAKLTADEFLSDERGADLRASIELEFRKRNQYPNFAGAKIGRIPESDPEYMTGLKAVDIVQRGNDQALKTGRQTH